MATHDDIGLSQPAASTITKRLRAFSFDVNSTVVVQEAMTLAGAESTLEIARVMASAPASTDYGLVVRVAQPSTTVNISSLAGKVLVDQNSTVWVAQVSSVAGTVQVHTLGNSSAADYLPVRLVDSSGTGFLPPGNEYTAGSTYSSHAGPVLSYDNSSVNTYRTVGVATPLPVQLRTGTLSYASTTALVTSTHSTAVYALVSSVASQKHKVYAYAIMSTHTKPSTLVFMSSLAQDIWAVQFGSGSSGVTGAVQAVSPPAFLFATEAQAALNVRVEDPSSAASTTIVRISLSYFTEA